MQAGVNGVGRRPALFVLGHRAASGTFHRRQRRRIPEPPTSAGTFNVNITVNDGGGAKVSGSASITILSPGAPVTIPSGALADATVNLPLTRSRSRRPVAKPPYTWALVNGAAPDGMSFRPLMEFFPGPPTTPGSYSFGVEVKDSSGGATSSSARHQRVKTGGHCRSLRNLRSHPA